MSKLVKYLPMHGITPEVLTVANPSVPLKDETLLEELPRDLRILKARTFEPGYAAKQAAWSAAAEQKPTLKKKLVRFASGTVRQLAYPDIQVLWQPAAQATLARALFSGKPPDVVLISGPPFSQFLLAPLARTRTAVVLDYRDEWSVIRNEYEMTKSRIARVIGDPLEALILRRANMVTTATEEFRENLLARFPFVDPARVVAIPNGFDPDDFPATFDPPPADRFVVTYVGTVFRLTSPTGFLGAIRRLHRAEPELAKLLDVHFIGRIVDLEAAAFEGTEELGVRRLGYMEHEAALRALGASHLVLCILDDAPGVERIYPAKIFELMHLRRPCLTLTPDGALSRLVEKHNIGDRLLPRDEEGIARYLADKLRAFKAGSAPPPLATNGLVDFDRRTIAGRFATVMRSARA
jgi:glycosyltransferase involved in cell wall biosynthesis